MTWWAWLLVLLAFVVGTLFGAGLVLGLGLAALEDDLARKRAALDAGEPVD